jgi:hypothetical protein
LLIWYDFADASTITITGAGISQITNKAGGGGFTLTQSTDADRPTWDGIKATGRGSGGTGLRFVGTVNFTNAAYTALIVAAYPTPNANTQRLLSMTDGVNFPQHFIASDVSSTNLSYRASNTSGAPAVAGTYVADTPLLMAYQFDGAANKKAWKNGINTLDNNVDNGPIVLTDIRTLNAVTTASAFSIVVTSSTTTAIRQKHEGFQAWQKNLVGSLDASHPYKTRPPLTTD